MVARIGLGALDDGVDYAAELPVAPAARFRANEILEGELARVEAIPHPAGAAEVRNARLGAHAGPREDHGSARGLDPVGDLSGRVDHERRLAFFFRDLAAFAFGFDLALAFMAGLR